MATVQKVRSSSEIQSLINDSERIDYSSIRVWRLNCGGKDFGMCALRIFISLNSSSEI